MTANSHNRRIAPPEISSPSTALPGPDALPAATPLSGGFKAALGKKATGFDVSGTNLPSKADLARQARKKGTAPKGAEVRLPGFSPRQGHK